MLGADDAGEIGAHAPQRTFREVPEGDTIHYAANRIRPILEGRVPDEIATPHPRFAHDRWPERLAGRAVDAVDAHGKHLFLRFEGELTIHSHLRMTGSWGVYERGARWRRSPRRAWLVIARAGHEVVQFDGPVLELMTEARTRFDQRIAGLGPDILAPRARRAADPAPAARGRPDAADRRRAARPAHGRRHRQPLEGRGLLGARRSIRGARAGAVSDDEVLAVLRALRPRMQESALRGAKARDARSTTAPAAPARAAGRRSSRAARATTTA